MANKKDIMMRIRAQDRTKQAFNSVKNSLNTTEKSLGKIKGVLASAFAVGVIANFARATIDMAFQLENTSQKLGVNAEALQRLRHVAKQTGVETSTFDMALQRFARRTAEAAMGTGEAKDALRQLGIQLTDSTGKTKSVEELFLALPDAFGKVDSESEKLRLAFKLFDSEGVALKNTLSLTSEEMQKLADIKVLSDNDIAIASEFKRITNDLGTNVMTTFQKAVVAVANDILKMGQAFGMVERDATAAMINIEIEGLTRTLQTLNGELPENGIFNAMFGGVGDRFASPETGISATEKVTQKIAELKKKLDELPSAAGKSGEGFKRTSFTFQNYVDELNEVSTAIDKASTASMKKFEDNIVNSLKSGKLEFQDFSDFVIDQLLRISIQQMILKPLTGFFETRFSAFGDLFKADGGQVKGGSPYIVGEKGAEMFVPNSSGQIITNENLKNMQGSSAPVNVNFSISTVDASDFDTLLASRKGMITAMISNAMNQRGKVGIV
jgi:hypothetical protein